MLKNNWLALIITFAVALAWLRVNDFSAQRGWISSELSRKIIHIGTGPLFVICWLLFDDAPTAPYLAALVPFALTTQFVLVGVGVIRDEAAVKAMSRTGDRKEILRGPLYYGFVFVLLTILYWKETPVGIVALIIMCGGDGMADVIGRRWGRVILPWSPTKSWAGSLGMYLGGLLLVFFVLSVYVTAGVFTQPLSSYILPLSLVTLAATLVESLPFQDIDNITITLAALVIGRLVF